MFIRRRDEGTNCNMRLFKIIKSNSTKKFQYILISCRIILFKLATNKCNWKDKRKGITLNNKRRKITR